MKTNHIFNPAVIAAALLAAGPAFAQKPEVVKPNPPPPPPPPPPVSVVNPTPAPQPAYVYEQKAMGGRPVLVTPEQANTLIEKFKAGYPKLGSPRLVIFVNRELIDQSTGLRLIARIEKTEATTNAHAPKVTSENRYRLYDRSAPSMADKQTLRDVERLFGRPLRMGGAALADQRLATQLMPDGLPQSLSTEGDQARKDRKALSEIADVAVEILISSKNLTVPGVSGDQTYVVPDIQATALRLSDARILGQAASTDVTGRLAPSMARYFSVQEVAEATALALMEDMLTGVR
jgi:hypothetical protein